MTQWYYSDSSQQRHGPLPVETLSALFRAGQIGLDTLVWRDGQSQWQPLSDFVAELGLLDAAAALPPPLPPRLTPAVNPAYQTAPKTGMSGCMIALIVGAVAVVPVIAILAAIALPAYQQYVLKSKVSGAIATAAPVKLRVPQYLAQAKACPGNGDAGFEAPEAYASGVVESITIGTFESDRCGVELLLRRANNAQLDGKKIWLEYDPADASWTCSSEIDDKYLPADCRG